MADSTQSEPPIWQYRIVVEYPGGERETAWSVDRAMTAERCRDIITGHPEVPVRLERRSVTFGEPEVMSHV